MCLNGHFFIININYGHTIRKLGVIYIKEIILNYLENNKELTIGLEELKSELDIKSENEIEFQEALDSMISKGELYLTNKGKYAIPSHLGLVVGTLQTNANGFGFLIPEDTLLKDLFIPADSLFGAMNGDKAIARYKSEQQDSNRSREAEIIRILDRANKVIVGVFEEEDGVGFVVPDNKKIFQDVIIPQKYFLEAKPGFKVVCEITKYPKQRRNPEGRIIEVLGHKDDPGTDILSIIREFDLPEKFPDKVQQYAKTLPENVPESAIKGRMDLRDKKIFTIDGADAKDLDDAISMERLENGNYYLGVHIADVSHYVKEGTAIDEEALKRGTSVYLVDRVVPMLPTELSNGICSLHPRVDRLTLSCFMEINNKGAVVKHEIAQSVIRSCERLVYEDITKLLDKKDKELMERYDNIKDELFLMRDLSLILKKERTNRGSIDFDIDEAKINLDAEGKPISIKAYERGIANEMIEEFMLKCNETIAQHMFSANLPCMYRIHEQPDKDKLSDFDGFIRNFGYSISGIKDVIRPKALQAVLFEAKGTPEENIISKLMLRSLQKAKYSSENLGHFGIAAKYYCHFTSPIRRYPDLVVHRMVKLMLENKFTPKRIKSIEGYLPQTAKQCSERERVAMDAERATDDLKKVEYMQDKIGQKYPGIISGVMASGIFVELENTIEGLVRVSSLDDDYYMYIEKHHCLMGKRTRKIYRLGDKVSIKVSSADMQNRRLDFVLDKEKAFKNNKDTNRDRKDNQGKKDFKRFKKVGQHATRRKGNSSKQKGKA